MPTKGTSWSQAKHGTVARYKKHKRDGEEACTPCKDANAESSRAVRDGRPAHESDKMRKRADSRARSRLVNLFPTEYYALYQEEMQLERQAKPGR